MGSFYNPTITLTLEEADELAASNTPVRCVGFSYALNTPTLSGGAEKEYSLVVVDRKGMGNYGRFFLRGETKRTRAIVRAGKIRRLVDGQGYPYAVAEALVNSPRGMEPEVGAAVEAIHALLMEGTISMTAFDVNLESSWRVRLAFPIEWGTMSHPRMLSTMLIAKKLWEAHRKG